MNTMYFTRHIYIIVLLALAAATAGCVHEFPEPEPERNVVLTVNHDLPWNLMDWMAPQHMPANRASQQGQTVMARYIYQVSPVGKPQQVVRRIVRYSADTTYVPFVENLQIPAGDWQVWVWNDFVSADADHTPLSYDAKNLDAITILADPYRGDDVLKDAFRGVFNVSVPSNDLAEVSVSASVTLVRPLTAYAIIATDYAVFTDNERRRTGLAPLDASYRFPGLDKYRVKFSYPLYLPSEYDLFLDRPIDSMTDLWFTSGITPLSADEALLGFDYVLINGAESAVSVALDIIGADGQIVGNTGTLRIPVKRGVCTVVRGDFLTSKASSGVSVNTQFAGRYDIHM